MPICRYGWGVVDMRVIEVERFGGPEVLVAAEAPDPVAGPGQVVVEVAAADVLFLDTMIRGGRAAAFFDQRPPYVPGNGVAGRVAATGPGVDAGWVGRAVIAHTGERGGNGGYAERAAVPVDALVPLPDGVGPREAAALLHDGATALGLFEATPVRAEQWVLITAAAGGMGLLLVQLARTAGARVVGAARGKRKLDLLEELGAIPVDYSEPDWAERARAVTGGAGPDVVLDGAGGALGRAAFEITARGGWFSGHGAPAGGFAPVDAAEGESRGVTVRGIAQVQFAPEEARRLMARALSEAAEGRIRPVIGQTFPLERAADAHAAIEAREVIGKTLLTVKRDMS